MLAPCDGPPPDAGVTPLGNSIADRGQRLDRPARSRSLGRPAHHPGAARRGLRRLAPPRAARTGRHRDGRAVLEQPRWSARSTPRATALLTGGSCRSLGGLPGASPSGVQCQRTRASLRTRHSAASTRLLFNGIEIDLYTKAPPTPTDGPTIFFFGRHEPRKGLDVLLEAMASLPANTRLWVGSDGPDTAELKARFAGDIRVEWLGRLTDDGEGRAAAGADVFCAPSLAGRVVRRGAARGDGGRHARRRQRPPRLPQRRDRRPSTRCWCPPATRNSSLRRSSACSPIGRSRRDCPRLASPGRGVLDGPLAEAYLEIYDDAIEAHAVRSR